MGHCLSSFLLVLLVPLSQYFSVTELCLLPYVFSQQDLYRVLKAYTLHRPEEGYCQAQAPIAAVLLMHMPAEVSLHRHTHTVTHTTIFSDNVACLI